MRSPRGVEIEIFGRGQATSEQIRDAISALRRSGSIDYASRTAHELVARGKAALFVLDDTPARSMLLELADYLIQRGY